MNQLKEKILLITLDFPPQVGGVATYIHEFALNLPKDKIIVLAPQNEESKEFDSQADYRIMRRNFYCPSFIWPRWLCLLWHVFIICRKEKIKIILLHHALPVGYIGIIFKKIFKIPFLVFLHGTDAQFAGQRPWKKRMLDMIFNHSSQIIFNSSFLKRKTEEIFFKHKEKFLILYPCPNFNLFSAPQKEEIEKIKKQYNLFGKKVILTVGRMEEGKGFLHLLRIFPEILKEFPDLIWVVVGDGSQKEKFLKEIEDKIWRKNIRYLGETVSTDLKNYYYLSDLFVLLTHPHQGREEGLGMVFLEAGACGLPVVAGKSGGVEEVVLNNLTGKVVNVFQKDKILVDSIVELLKNSQLAETMGQEAQKRIAKDFQWSQEIKKINKWLYD